MLAGLLSGGGGNTQTANTNSTTKYQENFDPGYFAASHNALNNAEILRDRPWQGYDVSNFGDMFNDDQSAAWEAMRGMDSSWRPSFDSATGAMEQYNGVNPITAGQASYDRAFSGPSALQAADPWTQKAGQSWNDVSSSYLNPYINDTVNSANALSTKNFLENVLPGLSASYVASGGGLGSKGYGQDMNWALTNFNDSTGRTTQAALADAYNKSAGIFQNDANRFGQLSSTVGGQATSDIGAYTGLGTAQGNNAATGINAGNSRANTFATLGTQGLNNDLMSTNAQLQAGNQQQGIEDWKNKFKYDQNQQEIQWPYQTNSWAADTINKYQWPKGYTSNTQGTTTQTGSASSSSSPFSTILGGLSAVGSLAMPGASGTSVFGNIFGSGGGGQVGGYTLGGANASGSGWGAAKRGGHFSTIARRKPKAFARGGYCGLDAPSTPSFNYNPGYFKWMDPAAFKRGGAVGYDEGGQVGGMLGKILGSLVGGFFGGPMGAGLGGMGGDALGSLLPFAAGGHAPVVKAARRQDRRSAAAARAKQMAPQGGLRRQLAIPNPSSGFFSGA